MFLLTNVLFVAMEVLPGSNIFSTPLDNHLHNQPWSPLAQELVSHRLEEMQTTLDAYAPIFNQAVARNAQSLVILMVLPFALFPPVLFRKAGCRSPCTWRFLFTSTPSCYCSSALRC